jgi:hypothetical protein
MCVVHTLSAGSLGCGNDLVEARIAAQRVPARIEAEIAVGWGHPPASSRQFRVARARGRARPSTRILGLGSPYFPDRRASPWLLA